MGLKLLTDDKYTVIYRKNKVSQAGNSYTTYSTKVSSKDADGNWQSAFLNVRFKKGVEVNNKAKIEIINSFPTLNTYNGNTTITWMILDFKVIEEGEVTNNNPISGKVEVDEFMTIPDGIDDEMPFA